MARTVTEPIRNRIVGHGVEAPDQLLANPRNWRIHTKAQETALAAVLDEVGWVQNVIVNQRTGFVVDGHLRVALAITRGEASVPVVYVDLDENEEAIALATIDPLSAMAGTDKDLLAELLGDVVTTSADLQAMLDATGAGAGISRVTDGLTDPDDVPADVEPRSKRGDLWLLGEHRVLCGDATSVKDVARVLGGKRASCMWTDPPYGVNYVGRTKDKLTIQNDGAAGLPDLLRDAFAAASTALRPGAAIYIARPAGALSVPFGVAFVEIGWRLHEELQWVKDSMVLGHSDYHLKHETVMYGYAPGEGRFGRGGKGWHGDDSQVSVFEVARPKASPDHPTGKPVELVEAMLRNSTTSGALVYDPFLGSGTTLIACEQLGRKCYGLEIAENYCDVIVQRWQNFTGRDAILEATRETFDSVGERVRSASNTGDMPRPLPVPSSSVRSKGKS